MKSKKILVVDDADVFRHLEAAQLKMLGHRVIEAKNGAEAVRLALEELPDLILLDVQMPVMDGMQALAFLTKDERTAKIPIVVITTIGREKDEEIIRRGGASGFLTKPLQPGQLTALVRRILGDDRSPTSRP